MTTFQRRCFIAFDEWAGIVLLCWCWHAHREVFGWVFFAWAIALYGISYPLHWYALWKERPRGEDDDA